VLGWVGLCVHVHVSSEFMRTRQHNIAEGKAQVALCTTLQGLACRLHDVTVHVLGWVGLCVHVHVLSEFMRTRQHNIAEGKAQVALCTTLQGLACRLHDVTVHVLGWVMCTCTCFE